MAEKKWFNVVEDIKPYIFKVLTPNSGGTGFQIFYSKKNLCGIATAYHVIKHAHEWLEPIKISHYMSNKDLLLKADHKSRVIIPYPRHDLAFLFFDPKSLPIEKQALSLLPPKRYVKPGVEIGWCGFPAMAPKQLCFFSGHVSSFLKEESAYLVDGVAINGISGGPALFKTTKTRPWVCGVVTAYLPNRVTGEALPGVCFVASVEPYQKKLREMKTLDEAEEKAEKEKKKREKEEAPKKPAK